MGAAPRAAGHTKFDILGPINFFRLRIRSSRVVEVNYWISHDQPRMRLPLSHASISDKVPSQVRAFVFALPLELSSNWSKVRHLRLFCLIFSTLILSDVSDEAAKRFRS